MNEPVSPNEPAEPTAARTSLAWLGWSVFHQIESHPAITTSFVVLLYILGFVVHNSHLSRFSSINFDLLQGRYIAAGLQFLLFTAFPLVSGMMLGDAILWKLTGSRWIRLLLKCTLVLAGAIMCVTTIIVLSEIYKLMGVKPELMQQVLWEYSTINIIVGFALSVLPQLYARTKHKDADTDLAGRVFVHFWMLPLYTVYPLAMATVFGQNVYGGISPVFGGGASWLIVVNLDADSALNSRVIRGALIEQNSDTYTLLRCKADDTLERNGTALSSDHVMSVQFIEPIPIEVSTRRVCR